MAVRSAKVGDVIDGMYRVANVLGRGGTATVYACHQSEDERLVAVKVLAVPDGGGQDIRKRFFNELLLATRIVHPNIVQVYDFGLFPDSGEPYIVMEHLSGLTLRQELKRHGPLSPERTARLFRGVLSALADAHATGVVHKDLKPSNLFLCGRGTDEESLVVLDFGVAFRLGEGATSGKLDDVQLSGTPAYMAPEYILTQKIWPGLDVYQMGLVLAEALAGRPLLSLKDPQSCLRKHVRGEIEIPDVVRETPLIGLIDKAVARQAGDRYQHCGEMLVDLDAVLAEMQARSPSSTALPVDFGEPVGVKGPVSPADPTVVLGAAAHEDAEESEDAATVLFSHARELEEGVLSGEPTSLLPVSEGTMPTRETTRVGWMPLVLPGTMVLGLGVVVLVLAAFGLGLWIGA